MQQISKPNTRYMITISSKVSRHHRKADGTYNVKICMYHTVITRKQPILAYKYFEPDFFATVFPKISYFLKVNNLSPLLRAANRYFFEPGLNFKCEFFKFNAGI